MQIFLTVLLTIIAINLITVYKLYKLLRLGNMRLTWNGAMAMLFHLIFGLYLMYLSYFRHLVEDLIKELDKHDASN